MESQLLLFDAGEFADIFTGPEFTVYPRLFLECDLRGRSRRERMQDGASAELELAPWTPRIIRLRES